MFVVHRLTLVQRLLLHMTEGRFHQMIILLLSSAVIPPCRTAGEPVWIVEYAHNFTVLDIAMLPQRSYGYAAATVFGKSRPILYYFLAYSWTEYF